MSEGNMCASDMARTCRTVGVHRPWHTGRDTSENSGSPRGSLGQERRAYGIPLLRHGRGNSETGQCGSLSVQEDCRVGEAEKYRERERPPDAFEVSYQA